MTSPTRPQPVEQTVSEPAPETPTTEPRFIVRRRSPGWSTPRASEVRPPAEATEPS
jgi:hypothetical protein